MRIIRFYHRLKNQYRIHRYSFPIWTIVRIAWSRSKQAEMVEVVIDRSVIPIIDDEIFPDLFPDE